MRILHMKIKPILFVCFVDLKKIKIQEKGDAHLIYKEKTDITSSQRTHIIAS